MIDGDELPQLAYTGPPKVWLNPIYPNPVVRASKIDLYWLFPSLQEQTTLKVYTISGIEVDDLTDELQSAIIANKATIELRAEHYVNGLYIVVGSVEGFVMSQMMMVAQ